MATATKTRKTYDPGQSGEILPLGNGQYAVESFRNSGDFYAVDLQAQTCSCPHHIYRGAFCKHLIAAEAHASTPSPSSDLPLIPCDDDDPAWAVWKQVRIANGTPITAYFAEGTFQSA